MSSRLYDWTKIIKSKHRRTLKRGIHFGLGDRPDIPVHVFTAQCYQAAKRLNFPITVRVLDAHTITIEPKVHKPSLPSSDLPDLTSTATKPAPSLPTKAATSTRSPGGTQKKRHRSTTKAATTP